MPFVAQYSLVYTLTLIKIVESETDNISMRFYGKETNHGKTSLFAACHISAEDDIMMVTLFRCLNRCGRPVRILYLVVVLFLFTTAGCGSNADTLGCAETTTAHTETDADIEQALITEDPVVPTDPGETDTDINESETDPVETTPAAVESTSPIVTEIPDSAVASPNASPEKI